MKPTFKGELMFPSKYLATPDLKGKEARVTIESISKQPLRMKKGGEEQKWVLRLVGKTKQLVLNVTNGETLVELYGREASEWIGKEITLYPTKCNSFGKIEDCIRIRDKGQK